MAQNFAKRCEKLSERVSSKNLDCIVITTSPNLKYFLNYVGQSYERFCCGLISNDGTRTALVIPKLDTEKARKSHAENVFPWDDTEGYRGALREAIHSLGSNVNRVGCEDGITLLQTQQIRIETQTSDFASISEEISNLRLIKDQAEIAATIDAANRLSRAYKALPELIEAGQTEIILALELIEELSKRGLKTAHFPLIQSGSNSAIPHCEPGTRKIRKGDMVVVDTSAVNEQGYHADYTRTYVIGKPTSKQREVYETVKRAQAHGIEAAIPRNSAQQVDKAARSVIEKAEYGEYFIHRTGHGLGLEVHEAPYLKEGNPVSLQSGMIFTVEPGIYLPGNFGARIEDNIIIDGKESKNVTALSHELVEI
jgi:Xaa-Pro aminopeptidase